MEEPKLDPKKVGTAIAFCVVGGIAWGIFAMVQSDIERNKKCATWHYFAQSKTHLVYKSECDTYLTLPKPLGGVL